MIRLTASPIDIQTVIDSVRSSEAGAVDVFIGTTRNQSEGRAVVGLEYEAFESMALKVMGEISDAVRARWSVREISIVHRTGSVEIGQASVVIAVSSVHRKEAFEACRFIIDTLKREAPIWKRELFADGSEGWSGQNQDLRLAKKEL
jgi:molybdopterin synthase catalytic subunit